MEKESYPKNSRNNYHHKIFQLSKAFWKIVEKDWNDWLSKSGLNINEHNTLLVAYSKECCTITDIALLGTMHISTAVNFSKSLEKKGLLRLEKNNEDKRVTMVYITEKGRKLVEDIEAQWEPNKSLFYDAVGEIEEVYGSKPHFGDIQAIVKNFYGDEVLDHIRHFNQ
ncbi:HTH-type transcriptional regulator Hpr [Isobaculum melis]|uniref:MarR family transcriptional regulator, protease production regulatory protein HPr n=1 Tax=Isobaculum melis TaxID=142588 RepID=A0A1H9S894_9LACT|nr:HTH-type transcriptional regulator Hpr [Isobaculum melis]SER80805.1 MarR family transcriptional regulator, protease production regulatory protein HPr [Isobaculum melis]